MVTKKATPNILNSGKAVGGGSSAAPAASAAVAEVDVKKITVREDVKKLWGIGGSGKANFML